MFRCATTALTGTRPRLGIHQRPVYDVKANFTTFLGLQSWQEPDKSGDITVSASVDSSSPHVLDAGVHKGSLISEPFLGHNLLSVFEMALRSPPALIPFWNRVTISPHV